MDSSKRPLSPHLQIYKWQLTSVLSILHRITGLLLILGVLLVSLWIILLGLYPEIFNCYQELLRSIPGKIILLGCTFSFFYHWCNGIRHLCWDAGFGFEIRQVYITGWLVVCISVILTVIFWIFLIRTFAIVDFLSFIGLQFNE